MKGERVEIVVDSGNGTLKYDIEATKAGRRVEVTTGRGIVEVTEVTRAGTPVQGGGKSPTGGRGGGAAAGGGRRAGPSWGGRGGRAGPRRSAGVGSGPPAPPPSSTPRHRR